MKRMSLVVLMMVMTAVTCWSNELRIIESREGVTARAYVQRSSRNADTLVLLLPGGNGAGHIKVDSQTGRVTLSTNFIVRTSKAYADAGMISVIMDTPSDAMKGLSDTYRKSDEQLADVTAILNSFPEAKRVFIISTSRAGISAGSLGAGLKDPRLKGVVFTATIQYQDYVGTTGVEGIKVPVLFVHHEQDGCDLNSLMGAKEIADAITVKNKNVRFITVKGGETPPGEDPCMPISVHGFYGMEEAVTERIIQWVTTR